MILSTITSGDWLLSRFTMTRALLQATSEGKNANTWAVAKLLAWGAGGEMDVAALIGDRDGCGGLMKRVC